MCRVPSGDHGVNDDVALGATACHNRPHRSMADRPRQAARRVAAVSRALAVMDALAAGGELGTNELARRIGVNASTVSRVLATLAADGYVDQSPSGRYRLGIRLVQLGNAVVDRLDMRELAQPVLPRARPPVGETATLSVPGEHEAMTVDFARSPSSVQSVAQIGRPSVAHATATGKVMLAFGQARRPARSSAPLHVADDRGSAAARARRREGAGRRLGRRRRGARGGPRRARRACAGEPRGAGGDRRRAGTGRATRRVGAQGSARAPPSRGREPLLPARLERRLTARSARSEPDEARRLVADPARRLAIAPGPDPRRIGADDEQPRCSLGHELEQRARPAGGSEAGAARPRRRASGRAPPARGATPRRRAATIVS